MASPTLTSFRLTRTCAAAVLLLGTHCAGDTNVYSAELDDRAIRRVVGVWTARTTEGEVRLELCEDVERAERETGGCEYAHVVRGNGRGKNEEREQSGGIGCGGCEMNVGGFVTAKLTFADEPINTLFRGGFSLGDNYGAVDYDDPYVFGATGGGAFRQSRIEGTIQQEKIVDARIELSTLPELTDASAAQDPDAGPETEQDTTMPVSPRRIDGLVFTRTGEASCPHAP